MFRKSYNQLQFVASDLEQFKVIHFLISGRAYYVSR